MVDDRLGTTWDALWLVPVSAVLILVTVILAVRIVGLRSFSKMSSFDFAVTLSIGSIMGSVAASGTSLADGALAVVSLLGVQALISLARTRTAIERATDNSPLLLMEHGTLLERNLQATRVTPADVFAKLRASNVGTVAEVRAVVLETTGDISVLHGEHLDEELLRGVRRTA